MSLISSATDSRQYHDFHKNEDLDATELLTSAGPGRSILAFKPKRNIFMQGCAADAVYYIKSGKVRLTVVSEHGREGVVAILGTGFFFGENCLTNPAVNTSSATAMVKTTVVRIEKSAMLRVLHAQPALCDMFMSFLVQRNKQIEADLLDHLFNSSEQRLARILLQLARLEESESSPSVIPRISQDILAARVGTTRSRINFFMNKFRKLGYIHYAASKDSDRPGLRVSTSLMNVISQE